MKAREEVKQFEGRKIFLSFANAKQTDKKTDKASITNTDAFKGSATAEGVDAPTSKTPQKPPKVADTTRCDDFKASYTRAKTVAVCGLPKGTTANRLQEMIKDVKRVAHVDFPAKGQENTAHLKFKCVRDAKRAIRRLQVMKLQATQLSKDGVVSIPKKRQVERAVTVHTDPTVASRPVYQQTKARLIVRNLSFKCTEQDLHKEFEKFGTVSEVKIPKKPDGRQCGFGFVQFSTLDAASQALNKVNSKKIMGRPVAVDWALAKARYVAIVAKSAVQDESGSEDEESNAGNVSDNLLAPKKTRGLKRKAGQDDGEDSDSDESDCAMSDSANRSEETGSDSDADDTDADINGDENSASEAEDDSEDSEDSTYDESKKKKRKKDNSAKRTKPERSSDVGEGRTIFVRNVPFEVDEGELGEAFEEFGELVYARLVLDSQTERPKGTAFVQFMSKEAADTCLERGQEEGTNAGIMLHGRRLLVTLALTRTEAQSQKQAEKTKEKKDSRNLFLAREGMIRPGTEAAVGISQEDMTKRMRIEQMKRERLKNQNIFVSSTRLCVHNIPTKVDEKELRQVLLNAAEDPQAKITECRVMRDMQRVNTSGVAKALGYAFVNFTQHEHALKALSSLNNSEVFGPKKRPIVEFSLENRRALELQEKRREKSKKAHKQEGKQPVPVNSQKQQDRIARVQHKGPKGLPKHFGPKIRHRDRSKQKGKMPQKGASKDRPKKKGVIQQPKAQKKERVKPMKKKAQTTDAFDNLVNKYKQKISKNSTKWFES